MVQTTKPELAQYFHAVLFIPTTASVLNSIKPGFLNTWPGLIEELINKHLEKSISTKIVHLHIRIQGLQSTMKKPPDRDLEVCPWFF